MSLAVLGHLVRTVALVALGVARDEPHGVDDGSDELEAAACEMR